MSRIDYKTYIIETDFGHIAVHYKGNILSQTAYVFLHGHLDTAIEHGSYRLFNGNDESLKILIDHRWHGSSSKTEYYPSCTERCEDVEIVLMDLGKRFKFVEDIYLMGHSQGATVALSYLLGDYERKHLIKKAFLLAPRLYMKGYLKWFEDEINQMIQSGRDFFDKIYRSKGVITYNKKFVDEFNELNHFDMISNLSTKTYLFRGDEDDRVTDAEALEIASLNSEYITYIGIKNCGHYLSEEQLMDFYSFCKNTSEIDHYEHAHTHTNIYLKGVATNQSVSIPNNIIAG